MSMDEAARKRAEREQLRALALAGDVVAQAKRAAERQRIESRFARTAEDERERLQHRRKQLREAAHDAEHPLFAHANAVLGRDAQRALTCRNAQRQEAFPALEPDSANACVAQLLSLYPSCEPSVVWRYMAEHPKIRDFDVLWFAPPGMREDSSEAYVPLTRRPDQPGQVGTAAPHHTLRHLAPAIPSEGYDTCVPSPTRAKATAVA
jgi:hypothetical protein